MPDKPRRPRTADVDAPEETTEAALKGETVAEAEAPDEAPEVAPETAPTGPAARYAALERIEDDPDRPYFVTEWNGLRNYHCRACADGGKHFASTRLERTMQHFSERHLPQTVDLGLVTPSGRPLRIRR